MELLPAPARRFFARLAGCPYPESPAAQLVFKYEQDADLLFARFGAPTECDTVVLEPGLSVRISRTTHQPVAVEVVDCSARFHKQPSAINAAFARELLAEYGRMAYAKLAEVHKRQNATLESALHTR